LKKRSIRSNSLIGLDGGCIPHFMVVGSVMRERNRINA
jgi:hypothetical protein